MSIRLSRIMFILTEFTILYRGPYYIDWFDCCFFPLRVFQKLEPVGNIIALIAARVIIAYAVIKYRNSLTVPVI